MRRKRKKLAEVKGGERAEGKAECTTAIARDVFLDTDCRCKDIH